MAWVDLESTVSAGSAFAVFDATSEDYLEPFLALLPRGRAWPREGLLLDLCHGLSMEFSRVRRAGLGLLDEIDPATCRQHLPDYERVLGLPECADLPEELEDRRDAVGAKLRGALGHDQSVSWWESLADDLGLEIWGYESGPGPFTVISSVVDKVAGEEWLSVFTFTLEQADDEVKKLFECQVDHSMSLEVLVVIHWRWSLISSGVAVDLLAVETGKGWIVVAGVLGTELYSSDRGATWTAGAALGDDVFALGYNDGQWLAGGVDGGVWETSDPESGPWLEAESLGYEIYAIDGVRSEIGYFHLGDEGGDAKIWTSTDNGGGLVGDARPVAHDSYGATHDADAWVQVGSGGTIFRSVDLGVTWGTVASGVVVALRACDAFTGTMVAVGDSGTIVRSANSGAGWSSVVSGTAVHLYGVAAYGGGRWVAVGVGTILESVDDGVTWTPAETQPTAEALRAVVIHEGRAVIVGDNGTIVME